MYQSLHSDIAAIMPEVRATGLLRSLATFSKPTGATSSDPAGELDDEGFPLGTYVDIAGLVDIACMAPPLSTDEKRISAEEMKGQEQNMVNAPKHMLLDDYYPEVEEGWRAGWRVTVDGIVYDVMGAESDSQSQMTRVHIRRVGY